MQSLRMQKLIIALGTLLCLLAASAQAYVYDDFNGSGINESLWEDSIPDPDLFSQPGDGKLYFADTTGYQTDGLRSEARCTTPFFVSMQYSGFQATNSRTEDWTGSGPVLWIGYTGKSVRVYEYKNASGIPQGFRAIKIVGDSKSGLGNIIQTNVDSARLGINYDGVYVSFWYDVGSGWQQIPLWAPYAPDFTDDPYFGIVGANAYGESLSFQVEQVELSPVPVPASLLLLGSGLLGLLGLGRRTRRS